jgi:hypothetical protein
MTAILAEFAPYLTPPNVLAVSPDFTLMTIVAAAIITAVCVWSAITLRKPRDSS